MHGYKLLLLLPLFATAWAAPAKTCRHRGGNGPHNFAGHPGGDKSSEVATPTPIIDATPSSSLVETTQIDTPSLSPTPSSSVAQETTQIGDNNAASPPAPTTSSTPIPAPTPVYGSSGNADQDLFLSLHNDFRAKYGAKALTWNQELADFAQGVANTCKMVHSGGPYGENLASGAGGGYDITKGFNSWANEASLYSWALPGFQASTGHFTQVVWKATTELGCAVAECADGTLFTGYGKGLHVVCEYRAAGNMVGDAGRYFRENVGTLIA